MVKRKSWDDFRSAELLWWTNRMLHLFGWAIVVEVGSDGKVTDAYPARVKFRGFTGECETAGFVGLSRYLKEHAESLVQEAEE